MLKEVKKYNAYGSDKPEELKAQYHMNCAETILRAMDEAYDLKVNEDVFRILNGFGGGFYCGYTCGAFMGAVAGFSSKWGEERPSSQDHLKKAVKLLTEEFIAEFGSLDCDKIKPIHRDPVTLCNPVKEKTALVVERVIKKLEA